MGALWGCQGQIILPASDLFRITYRSATLHREEAADSPDLRLDVNYAKGKFLFFFALLAELHHAWFNFHSARW
jgi:hypothetical protein